MESGDDRFDPLASFEKDGKTGHDCDTKPINALRIFGILWLANGFEDTLNRYMAPLANHPSTLFKFISLPFPTFFPLP